ncbi:MAGI3 [Lepeophtheirus salmonis]|uniref:MAGI3 n=1 Tax=Lepeophtheirus salmonis TaxID=72036 RepID=A0A7R8HC10_LEPSM|nr:MAGI3 [Lepeophtheirus salmonis]CAF2998927.1 MAGI3 [Lepeophtheirus salmonis]
MPLRSLGQGVRHKTECVELLSKIRSGKNEPWGFVIIGGKDQNLTVKVGKIKPYSPAEEAGLKTMDYVWQINGKEVFEMSHNDCVKEIKESGTSLSLSTERGDHIVPNFEEIWPSKKGPKAERRKRGLEYYYDAMTNGPQLSGFLPLAPNFTTVDTLEEMKEERITMMNPDLVDRIQDKVPQSDNPMAIMQGRKFDPTKSNALNAIN